MDWDYTINEIETMDIEELLGETEYSKLNWTLDQNYFEPQQSTQYDEVLTHDEVRSLPRLLNNGAEEMD